MNFKKILDPKLIMTGGKVALGLAAGATVSKLADADGTSPVIGIVAPLLGGGLVASMFGKQSYEIAGGMAAGGIIRGVVTYMPDVAQQANLSGIGYLPAAGSTSVHSVAGNYYNPGFTTQ